MLSWNIPDARLQQMERSSQKVVRLPLSQAYETGKRGTSSLCFWVHKLITSHSADTVFWKGYIFFSCSLHLFPVQGSAYIASNSVNCISEILAVSEVMLCLSWASSSHLSCGWDHVISLKFCTSVLPKSNVSKCRGYAACSKLSIVCLQQKCFRGKKKKEQEQQNKWFSLCGFSLSPVLPVTLRKKALCIRPTVTVTPACFPGCSWQVAPMFFICYISLSATCSPFS